MENKINFKSKIAKFESIIKENLFGQNSTI